MVPWVILVVAVAVVIRFTIEAILRRFNIQRVESDTPHGLQTLGGQLDAWARRRRAQAAAPPERRSERLRRTARERTTDTADTTDADADGQQPG